jgi:uncharacterized protein (DUF4415 family)
MRLVLKNDAQPPSIKAEANLPGKATAEHPEARVRHIVRGIVRGGLQPLPAKTSISLRVDQDVLEWFKAQGPGYQTRINTVLRAFHDASV